MTDGSKKLAFVQLDVFSSTRFAGNQLAVFPDGRGLSDPQMQSIARETNLSETTFIFPGGPATERERGTRVRIFTVAEELPFAGHPTLGTAFALRGSSRAKQVTLDLNVGSVPVRFEDPPQAPAFGEMTQVDPKFMGQHDRLSSRGSRPRPTHRNGFDRRALHRGSNAEARAHSHPVAESGWRGGVSRENQRQVLLFRVSRNRRD